MEVTYTLKPKDIQAFEAFVAGGKRIPRWLFLLILVTVAPAAAYLQWRMDAQRPRLSSGAPGNTTAAILATVIPIVIFGLFWCFILWQQRRQKEKMWQTPFFANPHTVALSPQSLFHRNHGASEAHTNWAAVHRVGEDSHGIYFLLSENIGLVVPAHAFAGADQMRQFFQAALGHWKRARGEEPGPPIPPPA